MHGARHARARARGDSIAFEGETSLGKRAQDKLASSLAREGDRSGRSLRKGHLDEAAHVVAVGFHLVARLRCAKSLQVGRPVPRKHDQRHARGLSLEHRGVVVRERRARGAHKRHGATRRLLQPQREKRGASLVDVHINSHALGLAPAELVRAHGERRRARTWAHHHLANTPTCKLVEKRRYDERRSLLYRRCLCHLALPSFARARKRPHATAPRPHFFAGHADD